MPYVDLTQQLQRAIESYDGPLPATGDSIEEVWFRQAVTQLYYLQDFQRMEESEGQR